jgi:peptide/nickel transport system substrate-binding protein
VTRTLFRLAGAALVASSLAAAVPAMAEDELIIGVSQFPSSLHPNIDPEVIKTYTLDFALRAITAFDKDWKNTCMLCTELPTLDNGMVRIEPGADGKPGMAVTVKLRPGLKWADGVPITTADLAFTAKVGRDPTSGFANTRVWNEVRDVEVLDPLTAVIHLVEVEALYDRLPVMLPEHVEAPVYARVAGTGDYVRQTTYNRAPTTPGLYNGPYRIAGYQSGQSIILEPNEHWTGQKPALRRIIIKAIENTASLQANLLSGDVDMAPGDAPALTIDQVLALRRAYPDRFTYLFHPALTYEHVDFNLDNPIIADVRVRRALLHALDRKTLVNKMFEGLQPVADSFVNPLDPMHAEGAAHYSYDPKRARALLAEAGWTPGDDGICRNAAGDRLSFEFRTTSGNRLRELQQQVMQSQWKATCIEVNIKNEPARTFFGETMKHRSFAGLSMYAWTFSISYPPRQTLASDQIPNPANGWGGSNYMDFRNQAMDAAIGIAESELDVAKRKVAWADMQRIYADQLPVLPLFFRAEAFVIPKWLKGVDPTGTADYSSLWAETWHPE